MRYRRPKLVDWLRFWRPSATRGSDARAERRKRLQRELLAGTMFRQLEPRRVLSVNAGFIAGVLDISITNDGGNTHAGLGTVDATHFFVDANGNGAYDDGRLGPAELKGLIGDLRQLGVTGDGGVGIFTWRGDFQTAPLNLANANGNTVEIRAIQSAELHSQFHVTGNFLVDAQQSLRLAGAHSMDGDFQVHLSSTTSQLDNLSGTMLEVSGHSDLRAGDILLGNFVGDDFRLTTLTFDSDSRAWLGLEARPGAAFTVELVGSSHARSVDIRSMGSVQLALGSSMEVDNGISLLAQGNDADLHLNGRLLAGNGVVQLLADDSIHLGSSGSIEGQFSAEMRLVANADLLDGNGLDELRMMDGSRITARSGTIHLESQGFDSGDLTLSQIATDNSSIFAIDILARGRILDGSIGESANLLAPLGTVRLTSQVLSIGQDGPDADIEVESKGLVFDAASASQGFVQISGLGNELKITEASRAGAGGSISAVHSLSIVANVTVGATTSFVAGNSPQGGDNLWVDRAAVIQLASGQSSSLRFAAGDDLQFLSGRIQTVGNPTHVVELLADQDHALNGALDGDRGSIESTTAMTINTHLLRATAAAGIQLYTQVDEAILFNSDLGEVLLEESGSIRILSAFADSGNIRIRASDFIEASDITTSATGATIDLQALNGINASRLSSVGNVFLLTTNQDVVANQVDSSQISIYAESRTGSVWVSGLSAREDIILRADQGSVLDAMDDTSVDVDAQGTVRIIARDGIGGVGLDRRLELADQVELEASCTKGAIFLRGIGDLTLSSVMAFQGSIDVVALQTVVAGRVDTSSTDRLPLSVNIESTQGNIIVQSIQAGSTRGSVTLRAHGSVMDGDTPLDDLDITSNEIRIEAITGTVGGPWDALFLALPEVLEIQATTFMEVKALAGSIALQVTGSNAGNLIADRAWLQSIDDLNATALTFTGRDFGLLADYDANGVGALLLGPSLSVTGDLRVEGKTITASDGTVDLSADRLLLRSGTGLNLGLDADQADLSTIGSMRVDGLGDLTELIDLDRDNIAVQTRASNASIVWLQQGSLLVSDDVIAGTDGQTTSTGSIRIEALGRISDIRINDVILVDQGDIRIAADNGILFGTTRSVHDQSDTDDTWIISSVLGSIEMEADANRDRNGSGGGIVMDKTAQIMAGREAFTDYVPGTDGIAVPSTFRLTRSPLGAEKAEVHLSADQTIRLGSLQTSDSGDGAVQVTSYHGAIVDSGDLVPDANIVAKQLGALTTLRSSQGIGDQDALEVELYAMDVVNRDSSFLPTSGSVVLHQVASAGPLQIVRAVNSSADGDIRVLVDRNDLRLTDSNFPLRLGESRLETTGGNVLLQAITGKVIVDSPVFSQSGSLHLVSFNGIETRAAIETGSAGNILLESVRDIRIGDSILGEDGDIFLFSQTDLLLQADVESTDGNVALQATRDVYHRSTVTAGQSVLGQAGANWYMATSGSIVAEADAIVRSQGIQSIYRVEADRIALIATGDIVAGETGIANLESRELLLNTEGWIGRMLGDADTNYGAIDIRVDLLAVAGGNGINLQQVGLPRDLTIATVRPIEIQVTANRVQFDRGTETLLVASDKTLQQDDVESARGPIGLQVQNGSLILRDGADADAVAVRSGSGQGILLETRGSRSSISMYSAANVVGSGGNITIVSANDIAQENSLTTSNASIFLLAKNEFIDGTNQDGIIMSTSARTESVAGIVRLEAQNEGDVLLGSLITSSSRADMGTTSIVSDGSILARGVPNSGLHIQSSTLRMVADANLDGRGQIGLDTQAASPGIADSPIRARIELLAARSADGVVLLNVDDFRIDVIQDVESKVVRPGGSVQSIRDSALSDVITTDSGSIKLQTFVGDIFVRDGNSDGIGIETRGAGSIVLQSLLQGDVWLDTGIVTKEATYVAVQGAFDETSASARVFADRLNLTVSQYAHLHQVTVHSLEADIGANATLDEVWQIQNQLASERGDDYLDILGQNLTHASLASTIQSSDALQQTSLSQLREQMRFVDRLQSNYALYLRNMQSLDVLAVHAGTSNAPNVYIETVGTQSTLRILGDVATHSGTIADGSLVLVAGERLELAGGRLESTSVLRDQEVNTLGSFPVNLNARVFDGGDGLQPRDQLTSTEFLIRANQLSGNYEDYRTHMLQRVVAMFGSPAEAGFMSVVGYADGVMQLFDVAGEEGLASELNSANQSAIAAFPQSNSSDAALFTRSTPFANEFLDSYQRHPTTIVVRRSDDFYLFENAASQDGTLIRDLTFESAQFDDVYSLGAKGATQMPVDPKAMEPPFPAPPPAPLLLARPTELPLPTIELTTIVQRGVEIAIYRVGYQDLNLNGQPEQNELPTPDEVLRADYVDAGSLENEVQIERALVGKRLRIGVVPVVGGGVPTVEGLEGLKAALEENVDVATGAYAIVEKGVDEGETVIDVFGVRDWPEDTASRGEAPLLKPGQLQNESPTILEKKANGSEEVPESKKSESGQELGWNLRSGESFMHSLGASIALVGMIWLNQEGRQEKAGLRSMGTLVSKNPVVQFTARSRRMRRVRRLLGEKMQ